MKSTSYIPSGRRVNSDNTPLSLPSGLPALQDGLQLIAPKWCIDIGAGDYIRDSLAGASKRAYKADLAHFRAWGGDIPAAPSQVAQYLAEHAATLAIATLRRRIAGIAKAHAVNGYPNPVESEAVKLTLRGIRRKRGKPQKQARPISCADLLRIVAEPQTVLDMRDRALLLVGFAGAFRRSELVALDVGDLEFVDEGLLVTLRRSKTDQEGNGRQVPIPYARGSVCPVRSLRRWLDSAGIASGPVFRSVSRSGRVLSDRLSAQSVALILKKRVAQLGQSAERISGHSLRSGFVTSAAKAGASIAKISTQTGHRSQEMVMRYVRDAEMFSDHPLTRLL